MTPMEMQGTPTEEASKRADALQLNVGLLDTLHKCFPGTSPAASSSGWASSEAWRPGRR